MIIGISGKKGSGKDLFARIFQLIELGLGNKAILKELEYPTNSQIGLWTVCKFADPLKDMAAAIIGCTRGELEDRKFKETPLGEEWNDHTMMGDVVQLTPRLVMQKLGTEIGRHIHINTWVNILMRKAKRIHNMIVSDVRFENEADAIKNSGGIMIRLERKGCDGDNHPSETSLDDYDRFDYIIDNNGTIEDLIREVRYVYRRIQEFENERVEKEYEGT